MKRAAAVPLVLVGLVAVNAVVYLAMGAGYVLDDWYLLSHAHFDGAWGVEASDVAAARPGSLPVYALAFGVFGRHALLAILLMAALNAATAVLTYRLLVRFVPWGVAAAAAALWVWLPTHTSTEVWVTCVIIAASQFLLMVALTLGLRDDRSRVTTAAACAAAGAAVLTYEASLPLGAVAVLVLPWLLRRRIDWPLVLGCAGTMGAAFGWIVLHWYSNKEVQEVGDVSQLLDANFGWGITGEGTPARILVAIAAVGIALAVARLALPSFRPATGVGERAVVAGLAVMTLGVLPFAFYFYGPLGFGDRTNYLSAVGGDLVWAGLGAMVAKVDRRAAIAAAVVLVVAAGFGRFERLWYWHQAGRDATAIVEGVHAAIPDPAGSIVVGPKPIRRDNIAAFLEDSLLTRALQLEYDDLAVRGHMSQSEDEFLDADPDRRFDIRPVSRLEPEAT